MMETKTTGPLKDGRHACSAVLTNILCLQFNNNLNSGSESGVFS